MENQLEAEAVTDSGSNTADAALIWCGAEAEERWGGAHGKAVSGDPRVKCCGSMG